MIEISMLVQIGLILFCFIKTQRSSYKKKKEMHIYQYSLAKIELVVVLKQKRDKHQSRKGSQEKQPQLP